MDENTSVTTVHIDQSGDTLVDQDSTEDDGTAIMLKVEADGVPLSDEPVTEEIQSMDFVSDDMMSQPQELAGFDQTQLVLQTIGGQVEAVAGGDPSAVSGTFVADASTLQKLIASGAVQITDANGQPIQFLTLGNEQGSTDPKTSVSDFPPGLIIGPVDLPQEAQSSQGQPGGSPKVKVTSQAHSLLTDSVVQSDADQRLMEQLNSHPDLDADAMARISMLTGPPPPQDLPLDTPAWAVRLRDCQKIGDYYRGWLSSEVELDLVLTIHKQQTQTMWGTRQSPCPSKPATRLMWKSQYVPFDGMPFLNAGSRAIVQECQYGPRRKGSNTRKDDMAPLKSDFKQTCPARIYIKKVKKFLEYQIDLEGEKKSMKMAMDRAFLAIKDKDYEGIIQERFYVQLPTEKAHEFHVMPDPSQQTQVQESRSYDVSGCVGTGVGAGVGTGSHPARVHLAVAEKIREYVSMGETRLYAIRKQLRKYVEKELFESTDVVPDKHNLQYFPTVNDLQNHIHQAIRDIEAGILPVSASAVNLELVTGDQLQGALWQNTSPHPETVTVTLTQQPGQEGHVISKVETNLSDGSTSISDSLAPDTAKLLAKLHPQVFTSLHQDQSLINMSGTSTAVSSNPSLIVSAADETTASHKDTTITLNIPQPALTQQGASEYTVVQTETGALVLAKADTMTNQTTGMFTIDTGGSVFPVVSTEASIIQTADGNCNIIQADGTILNLVTQPGEVTHDETGQSEHVLDAIQSERLSQSVEDDNSQSEALSHMNDAGGDEYSNSLNEEDIPYETKPRLTVDTESHDTVQTEYYESDTQCGSPDSKRRKIDVSSIKTENLDTNREISLEIELSNGNENSE